MLSKAEITLLATYVIFSVPGIIGNFLTVVTVAASKHLRKRPILLTMGSLAAADFLAFTLGLILLVIHAFEPPLLGAKAVDFIMSLFFAGWVLEYIHFILIALNRFVSVCLPKSRAQAVLGEGRALTAGVLGASWVLALGGYVGAIMAGLLRGQYYPDYGMAGFAEDPGQLYPLFQYTESPFTFGTLIIMIFCYTAIVGKLVRQRRIIAGWSGNENQHGVLASRRDRKLTLQLLAVMTLYAIPYLMFSVDHLIVPLGELFALVGSILFIANFAVNPVIYFAVNEDIRGGVKALFKRVSELGRGAQVDDSAASGNRTAPANAGPASARA